MVVESRRSLTACLGAGIYWGLSLRSLSAWYRTESEDTLRWWGLDSAPAILVSILTQVTIVAINVLATAAAPRFRSMRYVRAFAAIGLGANLAMALLNLMLSWFDLEGSRWMTVCSMVVRGIGMAGCMLLWGLYFAFLEKRQAGRLVMLVAAIGMLVYYASILVLPSAGVVFDSLGFALSLVCALIVGPEAKKVPRDFNCKAMPSIACFYLSRAGIGFCLGFSSILLLTNVSADISTPLVVTGALLSVAATGWLLCSGGDSLRGLPMLPLVAMGLLLLPCSFQAGTVAFGEIATVLTWFCWIALSSFQLSELKERYGMSEAALSFSEKTVVMGFWVIGDLLARGVTGVVGTGDMTLFNSYFAVAMVYGAVLVSTARIWGLVYSRKQKEIIEELSRPERERRQSLFDDIARKYGLSAREREVLELLADGHTRKYIQDALGISDGTAKAHAAHVYQKLGIHKKEELFALVGREKGRA